MIVENNEFKETKKTGLEALMRAGAGRTASGGADRAHAARAAARDDAEEARRVADLVAACPADAHPSVKEVCQWVGRQKGGRGAVREFCDFVLSTRPATADTQS